YVNDHTALNTDITTTLQTNVYTGFASIVSRMSDDLQNYLGASFTTQNPTNWTLYTVVGGTTTVLQSTPLAKSYWIPGIGLDVDHRLRFRAMPNADNTPTLSMKVWRVGATEPSSWLLQATLPASSPFATTPGRFGILAGVTSAGGGRWDFDDFNATYFEGAV